MIAHSFVDWPTKDVDLFTEINWALTRSMRGLAKRCCNSAFMPEAGPDDTCLLVGAVDDREVVSGRADAAVYAECDLHAAGLKEVTDLVHCDRWSRASPARAARNAGRGGCDGHP
ncbi:MAG: hypothetical protein ACRDSR_20825 [Pseudonocardiaceae bacterium]